MNTLYTLIIMFSVFEAGLETTATVETRGFVDITACQNELAAIENELSAYQYVYIYAGTCIEEEVPVTPSPKS